MSCVRKKYIPINEPIPVPIPPEVKTIKYSSPRVETLGSPSTFLNYLTDAYGLQGINNIISSYNDSILDRYVMLKSQGKLDNTKFIDSELKRLGFDVELLFNFFRNNVVTYDEHKMYRDYNPLNAMTQEMSTISNKLTRMNFLVKEIIGVYKPKPSSQISKVKAPVLADPNISEDDQEILKLNVLLLFIIFTSLHFKNRKLDMIITILYVLESEKIETYSEDVIDAHQRFFTILDTMVDINNLLIPIEVLMNFMLFDFITGNIQDHLMKTFNVLIQVQVKYKLAYNENKSFQRLTTTFRQQLNSSFIGKLTLIPEYRLSETIPPDCKGITDNNIFSNPAEYWHCNINYVKGIRLTYSTTDNKVRSILLDYTHDKLSNLFDLVVSFNDIIRFSNSIAKLVIKASYEAGDNFHIFVYSLLRSISVDAVRSRHTDEIIRLQSFYDAPIFTNLIKLLVYLDPLLIKDVDSNMIEILIRLKAWDILREQFVLLCNKIKTSINTNTYDNLDKPLKLFYDVFDILLNRDMKFTDDIKDPSYQYMVHSMYTEYNQVFNRLFQQESSTLNNIPADQIKELFKLFQTNVINKPNRKIAYKDKLQGNLYEDFTKWKNKLIEYLIDNKESEASDDLKQLYELIVDSIKSISYSSPAIESELLVNIPAFYSWYNAVDINKIPRDISVSVIRKLQRLKDAISK